MEGMNVDVVYVALGHPSRVVKGSEKGVKQERWIYTDIQSQEIPAWRDIHEQTAEGNVISHRSYDPIRLIRIKDDFEVKFENGKVTGWRVIRDSNSE